LKTIEAFTHKDNTASNALLEKQKFVLDPERRDEGFENNRSYRLEKS
jgi:ribosomal-protein-alanine N-acetyltransferase